jgi:hypothetical protein
MIIFFPFLFFVCFSHKNSFPLLTRLGIVSLIKRGTGAVCLAIGDGANDVSMLQVL